MAKISLSKHLRASPERVFAAFTDFGHAAENVRGIVRLEVLTGNEVGVGTRFRETRIVFKKEATEEMAITSFDPPRSYSVGCESHGAVYETTYRFTPEEGGTRVEMEFSARPVTLVAKLLSPLAALMIKACAKAMEEDVDDLRKLVEESPEAVRTA